MPADHIKKQEAAQDAVDILHEIATILNCDLDRRTLSICISMIENGKAVTKLREAGAQAEHAMASQPKR